jgi:hypothetical protein
MLTMHSVQEALFKTTEGAHLSGNADLVLEQPSSPQRSTSVPGGEVSTGGWLARLFERMEARDLERSRREFEEYLADATDLVDLEARIRRYDRRLANSNAF